MKKLISWLGGFFDSDSTVSSKRLVGIVGAGFLYYTLFTNSQTDTHVAPAESLVWATVVLVCTSLGLASVKEITDLMSSLKNDKKEEAKNEGT